jgi:hypothetical protein
MHALSALLLLTALTIQTPALVLKSGKRIAVDEPVRVNSGLVLFRSNGTLYSVPSEDVDLDATRAAANPAVAAQSDDTKKLNVSSADKEKLLRELESNHNGTPASREQMTVEAPKRPDTRGDERAWRSAARSHEEQVVRAKEQLDLLRQKREDLKAKVVNFLSLGYKPAQFSYETTQLALVEDQIPQAELEVKRAERAQAQFLDNARREGVLPGWLR